MFGADDDNGEFVDVTGCWWCDAITAAVTDDSDEYSVD